MDRYFEENIIKTLYHTYLYLLNLPTMHLHSDVPAARPRDGQQQQGVVTHDTAVTIVLASGCNLTVIV